MNSLKLKISKFSNLLMLITALLLATSSIRSIIRINKAGNKVQEVQEKIESLEKENEGLDTKLSEIKSQEYAEKQLRDKLGLAKEGEIVVVLPEEEVIRKFAPKLPEDEEVLPQPNWKKWLHLFGL